MAAGVKHVEIAVSDLTKSMRFYEKLFRILGWKKVPKHGFVTGPTKVYLKRWPFPKGNTLGARHVCFHAQDRAAVNRVGAFVKKAGVRMIRGPMVVPEYSPDYYTVDFFDPDGYMLEVAHTPDD